MNSYTQEQAQFLYRKLSEIRFEKMSMTMIDCLRFHRHFYSDFDSVKGRPEYFIDGVSLPRDTYDIERVDLINHMESEAEREEYFLNLFEKLKDEKKWFCFEKQFSNETFFFRAAHAKEKFLETDYLKPYIEKYKVLVQ